jgi:small subunit ribosomal protein S5
MRQYHDSRRRPRDSEEDKLDQRIVEIIRTAKVLKGGRRFAFRVLVVVGDNEGQVGVAVGKANEVPEAIRKGYERAQAAMIRVPLINGTVPHEVRSRHAAATMLLRPAAPGTGVIAGHAARAVLEAAGVQNILTKNIGSTNAVNATMATFEALKSLKRPETEARRRGRPVMRVSPFWSGYDER